MQLRNDSNLVGDVLGTTPMMIDLAKANNGLEVFQTLDEGKWIYDLIPQKYNIKLIDNLDEEKGYWSPDLSEAFAFSHEINGHMTQCWHHQVELQTPLNPIRPELVIPETKMRGYDYVLAPFGRSAPDDQKWQNEKWQQLIDNLIKDGNSVCVIGNPKLDFKDQFYNCTLVFDRTLAEIGDLLKKCNKGCISIVTGISQYCFALGTKNYVFCNQSGMWGQNPDGINIETYIPRITVEKMMDFIKTK